MENGQKYMTDRIVEIAINKFKERSELGIKKYNTTLEQNNTDDFINHALEEAMDFVLYLTKIKEIMRVKGVSKLEELIECKQCGLEKGHKISCTETHY